MRMLSFLRKLPLVLIASSLFAAPANLQVDTKTHAISATDGSTIVDAKAVTLTLGGFTIYDGAGVKTIVTGSTSGVQFGATGNKIGFLGATPIVRPIGTTDLRLALISLGLYSTGGASPLNLNGGTFTAGIISGSNETLSGTLGVSGNTTFGGTLGITGATTGSSLTLSGNSSVGGTFTATGASTLHVVTATNETLTGTLDVTGNVTFGGTLGVTGATTGSSLALSGNEMVGGTLSITGATSGSAFTFTGNGTIGGTFGVTGATTLNTLNAATAAFTGNETVGGTFGVAGATTLNALAATTGNFSANVTVSGLLSGEAISSTAFSGPGNSITATVGSTPRTIQAKLRDSVSVKDYGAIGDNSANDTAAFSAALASSYPVIYVPEGTYAITLTEAQLAGKRFTGPGFINGADYDGPANFTRLDVSPSNGGESLSDGIYQKIDFNKFVLDGNSRQALNAPYYNYATTPHGNEVNFRSGGSGFTAYLSADANMGNSIVTLNAVDELTVGNTIDFYSTDGTSNRRTITSINTGAKQITLDVPIGSIGNDVGHYVANRDWVLKYARTHNDVYYVQLHHLVGGDSYIYGGRGFAYHEISAGATKDFELNSTLGFIGGELNAVGNGLFLTPYEFIVNDSGHDIAAMSMINYQRSRGPYPDYFTGVIPTTSGVPTYGKHGDLWIGMTVTSNGGPAGFQPLDAAFQIRGYSHVGFDFVPGVYNQGGGALVNNSCAIGLADGQKIFFNNTSQPNDTFTAATSDLITPANQSRPGGRLEFNNDNIVHVLTTGALPGGLLPETDYFVVSATATTLKLSATLGGSPIDITSTGTGTQTITSSLGKSVAVGDVIGDMSLGYNSTSDSINFQHGPDRILSVTATGVQVNGRANFKGYLTGTGTFDFGTIAPGGANTFSISVPGTVEGDTVEFSPVFSADPGFDWKWEAVTDGVLIVARNRTSGSLTSSSATYRAVVLKF